MSINERMKKPSLWYHKDNSPQNNFEEAKPEDRPGLSWLVSGGVATAIIESSDAAARSQHVLWSILFKKFYAKLGKQIKTCSFTEWFIFICKKTLLSTICLLSTRNFHVYNSYAGNRTDNNRSNERKMTRIAQNNWCD